MIKAFLLLIAVVLLPGCVNLHVHFPDASGKSETARESGDKPK
jgi:cytosine/adenosine deaminase-related metal-dependent hydrolase